jgi:hypothetical protein
LLGAALVAVMIPHTALAAAYTWAGGSAGAWSSAASWSPARTTPDPSDELTFDSGDSVSVSGLATTTITRLAIINGTRVHLAPATTTTLTIGNAGAGQLLVGPGATVSFGFIGPPPPAAAIRIATGATALIQGAFRAGFSPNSTTLDAIDSKSIVFAAGGLLEQWSTAAIFTTSGTDSVAVFEAGSRFVCRGSGSAPFGLPAPRTKVLFRPGSLYLLAEGNRTLDLGARRYGDLWLQSTSFPITGTGGFEVDSLTVEHSNLDLDLNVPFQIHGALRLMNGGRLTIDMGTSWTELHLKHDITMTPDAYIQLQGYTARLVLDGPQQQAIGGAFLIQPSDSIVIANPNHVRLNSDMVLQGNGVMSFRSGRLITGSRSLRLNHSGTANAGQGTGWVAGTLIYQGTALADSAVFDVGDENEYAPVTLRFSGLSGFPAIAVTTTAGDHPQLATSQVDPAESVNRYWTVAMVDLPATFTSYSASFRWPVTASDPAFDPAIMRAVQWSGSAWTNATIGARTPTFVNLTGLTSLGAFAFGNTMAQTYLWTGAFGPLWTAAQSWSPARTIPHPHDKLVIDRPNAFINGVPTQTVSQLLIGNQASVYLTSNPGCVLTITGGPGIDFAVPGGSSLTLTAANPTHIRLGAGATGGISGLLYFDGAPSTIDAVDAGAITFESTSQFFQSGSSNAFTSTGTPGTVVFRNGSIFYATGVIGSPFGLPAPASKVVFEPQSRCTFEVGQALDLSGRTYGRVSCGSGAFTVPEVTSAVHMTSLDLVLCSMTLPLNADLHVLENFGVWMGSRLTLTPSSTGRVVLDGTQPQLITVPNPLSLKLAPNARLTLSNPSGAIMNSDLSVPVGTLELDAGVLTTNTYVPHLLTIGAGASVVRGSGWITGNLKRGVPVSGLCVFDLGTPAEYLPVTLQMEGLAAPFDMTVVLNSGRAPLLSKSCLAWWSEVNRNWDVTPGSAPAFTSAAVTVTWSDGDLDPGSNPATLTAQRFSDGVWWSPTVSRPTLNSARIEGLTGFGRFAVAQRVGNPVHFDSPPANTEAVIGQPVDLYATVSGDGPFTYQWRQWGVPLSVNSWYEGVQTPHLHTAYLAGYSAGNFDVVVTGACGQEISPTATVTPICDVPRGITEEPADLTVPLGSPATFHVAAQQCHMASYSWVGNGVCVAQSFIANETVHDATYTIPSVAAKHAGLYYCVIYDWAGRMTTRVATLNVTPPVLASYTVGTPSAEKARGAMTFTTPVTGTLEYGNTPLLGSSQPLMGGQPSLAFDVPQVGTTSTYYRVRAQADNHEIRIGAPSNTNYVDPAPGVVLFPPGRPMFNVSAIKYPSLSWSLSEPTLGVVLEVRDPTMIPTYTSSYVVKIEDLRLGTADPHLTPPPGTAVTMPFTTVPNESQVYYFVTSETGAVPGSKLWLTVKVRWYESAEPDAKSYPLQFSIPFEWGP